MACRADRIETVVAGTQAVAAVESGLI